MENLSRDEYHKTVEFRTARLLNNFSHEITHKTQQLMDVLDILLSLDGELVFFDKHTLMDRQAKIVHLEVDKLQKYASNLIQMFENRLLAGRNHKFEEQREREAGVEPMSITDRLEKNNQPENPPCS